MKAGRTDNQARKETLMNERNGRHIDLTEPENQAFPRTEDVCPCGHVRDIHNPACGGCECVSFKGEDARTWVGLGATIATLTAERNRYRNALEALHHELNLGEASEGDIPAIESCARIVSMALRGA